MDDTNSFLAFVGAFADTEGDNLFSYRADAASGELTQLAATRAGENPSFLAVHPDGEYLYAINEVESGAVVAFSIDRRTGALSLVNRQPSGDAGPCHCSVDATGSYVMVAHYAGGSVSLLPIRDDGGLEAPADVVDHEGSSVDPERQTQPHPHSIATGPENRFVYVPDLGADRVVIYELDLENGELRPAESPRVSLHDGAGPRHFDIHPNGRVLYLLNELDATLATFDRDPRTGALEERATTATLPAAFDGDNLAADVHAHPSGRWVYASNRGHDSVAILEIGPRGGISRLVDRESTRGASPRNFALDPTGTFLYAENGETDAVVVFRIDSETGELEYTGQTIDVQQPSCMKVLSNRLAEDQ